MITLYEDQQETVNEVSAAMRQGYKSILLQSATGSGKSVMATYMAQRARSKGKTVWFDVPRRNLLGQMHGTFNNFNVDHSYIAAGNSFNPFALAYLTSTETLRRRLDTLKAPDLAFIDETHFGGAGRGEIIKWLKKNGTWIVGLSATPWLLSGQGLGCWYDHMVCGKTVRWLMDNNRLSDYRPFAPDKPDLSRVGVTNGDFKKGELSSYMEQDNVLIGNAAKHYKENAMGTIGIAFCTSIKHSQLTAETFRKSGIPAAHIDGKTPIYEKNRIIKAYAKKELLYLTNCELLTFGFDLASQVGFDVTIETMSDLRPTKSLALQMQKWGRVLRKKDKPAMIFDHANNFVEHGFPCDDRKWTLEDRVKGGGGIGGVRAMAVKECKNCYFCHPPAMSCPACGFIYPVEEHLLEEIEGELKEIERVRVKKELRMEVGSCKTLADLRTIQKERGYAPAWVFNMAKAKNIRR